MDCGHGIDHQLECDDPTARQLHARVSALLAKRSKMLLAFQANFPDDQTVLPLLMCLGAVHAAVDPTSFLWELVETTNDQWNLLLTSCCLLRFKQIINSM